MDLKTLQQQASKLIDKIARSYLNLEKKKWLLEGQISEAVNWKEIKDILSSQIETAYQAGVEEVVKEIEKILEDEIATAHTSKAGKTSRLTSAYMRIKALSSQLKEMK